MTTNNATMLERAYKVLPGASLGSFFVPSELDLVVASGAGPRMTDLSGKTYLDYVLGSGPLVIGHAHPAVTAAVQQQIVTGSSYYALNVPSILLAEELVKGTPGADMAKFCSSGSEATFFALRLARAATGRNKVLKFEGGYHGSHDYALMSTTPTIERDFPRPVPDTAGIPRVLEDEVLIAPFNDLDVTLSLIEQHADDLAAVIVEPECRLVAPKPGFIEALRAATTRIGAKLVFDEVVMGFRLRYGSVQGLYGVQPDLVAYGKIIGGGYPLAAVVGPKEIMELSNPRKKGSDYVYISGTLSGNPTAAAAGLATLGVLNAPGVYDRLNASGERLRAGIAGIAARLGFDAQVIGSGAMANIYFGARPLVDYRSVQSEDKALKTELRSELIARGVLTNLFQKMYVSTEHTAADIDWTLGVFDDALTAIKRRRAPSTAARELTALTGSARSRHRMSPSPRRMGSRGVVRRPLLAGGGPSSNGSPKAGRRCAAIS